MLRRIVLLVSILVALLLVAAAAALVLIDPDDYREEIAERASAQLGREVRLEGPLELKLFPRLAIRIREARVGNPPGFENAPLLADIGLATASIRLWPLVRGELEIGAITLEDAELALVTDAAGRSNLDGLFAGAPDRQRTRDQTDLSGVQTGPVRLRNVTVGLVDLADGEQTELVIDSLELDPFVADQPVAFKLVARILDNAGVQLTAVRVSGDLKLAADASRLSIPNLELAFEQGSDISGRATADAVVRPGGEQTIVELAQLAVDADLAGFALGLQAGEPVRVVAAELITVSVPASRLSLDGDELDASGELTLDEIVSGRLNLSGRQLDLRRLAALESAEPTEASAERPDFSPLQRLDLRLQLRLDELILAEGLRLSEVSADSRLANGVMRLDPIEARLFSGRFDGRAEVDFNHDPPRVSLSPRLSGVRVQEITALFSERSPVTGQGNLTLDLSFSGFELAGILATLDGQGQLEVNDGAIEGIDLQRLVEQELSTAALGEVREVFAGSTPFRQLSASLRAEQGVIELPELNLQAAGYGAQGAGRVNFAEDRLEYQVDLDLGEELAARLPDALRRATGGRIPLTISGPLGAPVVSVDVAGLVERTARDEIGRRLLDRLERGRDRQQEPDEPVDESETETEPPPGEQPARP